MKHEYPKWLYGPAGAVLVQGPEEHAALGDEYRESPAEEQPEPKKKRVKEYTGHGDRTEFD